MLQLGIRIYSLQFSVELCKQNHSLKYFNENLWVLERCFKNLKIKKCQTSKVHTHIFWNISQNWKQSFHCMTLNLDSFDVVIGYSSEAPFSSNWCCNRTFIWYHLPSLFLSLSLSVAATHKFLLKTHSSNFGRVSCFEIQEMMKVGSHIICLAMAMVLAGGEWWYVGPPTDNTIGNGPVANLSQDEDNALPQ